jgi:hypothetical protein
VERRSRSGLSWKDRRSRRSRRVRPASLVELCFNVVQMKIGGKQWKTWKTHPCFNLSYTIIHHTYPLHILWLCGSLAHVLKTVQFALEPGDTRSATPGIPNLSIGISAGLGSRRGIKKPIQPK